MIAKIREFTGGMNFANAMKITLAAVIPVILLNGVGYFEYGFTIAVGALLTYPSDIPSNKTHKIRGVSIAALIVAGSNLLVNVLHPFPYLLYPVFTFLIFFLAMISVYGQRANMVSFSGLLALSLAFAHIHKGTDMLVNAGLMLAGGLFYLLISIAYDLIWPHRYVQQQIAECIRLTAKYMKLRGDLWDVGADRTKIIEKQLHLQVELNTIHENLREILIRYRSQSGASNENRKMLLVFVSCVEILELGLSTAFNHNELHQKFSNFPKALPTYQQLAYHLAATLKRISKSISNNKQYQQKQRQTLNDALEALEQVIASYRTEFGETAASEGVLMLSNMLHYAEKQIEKIRVIERAFSTKNDVRELTVKDRELEKLITPVYYPFNTFKENLSFSSLIFRHSLRITATILLGLIVGNLLPLQNPYWILLTIIVIMRPGYGLTKERSYNRIVGTVLGGVIAFAALHFIHNHAVIGTIAVVSMLLGFAFTQINYKVGATFVTMYVVFIYALLMPENTKVAEFRILDTAIGGALAFIANYLLWPSWEFLSLPAYIRKSVNANANYLREIKTYYAAKGDTTPAYRVARKNAFVETGNLMASFQRMSQEPKSKQKQIQLLYKIVELNHTLLSASASIGTYIQTHHTTKSSEAFNVVMNTVIRNLDNAIKVLNHEVAPSSVNTESRDHELDLRFTELKNLRAKELRALANDDDEFYLRMQESQLVIEQLVWLINLSESIVKAILKLEEKH
ncbi:FUSC family protein [Flavobacterium magnum]|uniref:FUSC family protein n=1 Tax=Flavobacterium magnum TaxID=2162713 RepID=A0A2S0RKL3_9FLAO|nr:FUSC family membrane protein [Flavobacterium magnum]AWA31262.1 FUSC family protein [Flavobacterium magnum]